MPSCYPCSQGLVIPSFTPQTTTVLPQVTTFAPAPATVVPQGAHPNPPPNPPPPQHTAQPINLDPGVCCRKCGKGLFDGYTLAKGSLVDANCLLNPESDKYCKPCGAIAAKLHPDPYYAVAKVEDDAQPFALAYAMLQPKALGDLLIHDPVFPFLPPTSLAQGVQTLANINWKHLQPKPAFPLKIFQGMLDRYGDPDDAAYALTAFGLQGEHDEFPPLVPAWQNDMYQTTYLDEAYGEPLVDEIAMIAAHKRASTRLSNHVEINRETWLCPWCNQLLGDHPGHKVVIAHCEHCHWTGRFRGYLASTENPVFGKFENAVAWGFVLGNTGPKDVPGKILYHQHALRLFHFLATGTTFDLNGRPINSLRALLLKIVEIHFQSFNAYFRKNNKSVDLRVWLAERGIQVQVGTNIHQQWDAADVVANLQVPPVEFATFCKDYRVVRISPQDALRLPWERCNAQLRLEVPSLKPFTETP